MRLLFTKDANETLRPLLDRMPVMLHEKNYDRWLDPKRKTGNSLGSPESAALVYADLAKQRPGFPRGPRFWRVVRRRRKRASEAFLDWP